MTAADPPERVKRPLMVQHWRQAAFIHWPYPAAAVQPLLPGGLEAETCGGQAWVGLVPFLLTVRWLQDAVYIKRRGGDADQVDRALRRLRQHLRTELYRG